MVRILGSIQVVHRGQQSLPTLCHTPGPLATEKRHVHFSSGFAYPGLCFFPFALLHPRIVMPQLKTVTIAAREDLPSHQFSLDEFVVSWAAMEPTNASAAAALALVGIVNEGEKVSIDVEKYFDEDMADVVEQTSMTRDYDSLCGVSYNLPYMVEGDIYINPPLNLTLVQDNHVSLDVVSSNASIYA
jgi:hypothetical protein